MSSSDQEQRILQYGDDAVERPLDAILNDSSVAEPFQKSKRKKRKKATGKLVLITANGYGGFDSKSKEINALEGGSWLPHTEDFNNTASHTRGKIHFGASNADEFFGALQSVKGNISRIVFIGHGSPGHLGLSGDPLNFFGETLDSNDIERWRGDINTSIKPKLLKNAKLDLVACNLAVSGDFMAKLSKALGVCVRAFNEPVLWCTTYNKEQQTIISRGRIGAKSIVVGKSCGRSKKGWFKGVNKFIPPIEQCP